MSIKGRIINKGIIEAMDKNDTNSSVNIQSVAFQSSILHNGITTKKNDDLRSTASFIFNPSQYGKINDSGNKPHTNLQKYSIMSNAVSGTSNNGSDSTSVNGGINTFLANKTQYKLFSDNNKFLNKTGKSLKEISITGNLSNSSAVILPDAGSSKLDFHIKKKSNITNSAIKSIRSVKVLGANSVSNKLIKDIPQSNMAFQECGLHENKRNEGKSFGKESTVLTSMGSCEMISSSLCKGEINSHDTCDNTYSNTSTIKRNNRIIKQIPGLNPQKSGNKRIENPEDLHIFYVKTIQSNKELLHKFDKED